MEKSTQIFTKIKYQKKVLNVFCLSVILIDSFFRKCSNYKNVFRRIKYVVKEKKIPKYIIENREISSDADRKNSDKENSNEEKSDEEKSNEESSNEEKLKKTKKNKLI